MKICSKLFSALLLCASMSYAEIYDLYDFSAKVKTPRVTNNEISGGVRKYQTQTLKGQFRIVYDDSGRPVRQEFTSLTNRTVKAGGEYVGYSCRSGATPFLYSAIGSNKTLKFKTGTISFSVEAQPAYAAFAEISPDNSLYIQCSGKGTVKTDRARTMSGYLTGTLGCACSDFGHISPTRLFGAYGPVLDQPVDTASVWGTWSAKWRARIKRER